MARRTRVEPKRVTVIGLGRFGRSLAQSLHELGAEVTAIDQDARLIDAAASHVTLAARGDATDEEMLSSLDVQASDVAVVALGESIESSVISTLLLKRLGVPIVIATAKSELHAELLRRTGADRIVFPEHDAAVRLARGLDVLTISDYLPVTSTAGVFRASVPAGCVGQSLAEIRAKESKSVLVLLIERGDELVFHPGDDERLQAGDLLIVFGPDREVERFLEAGRSEREAS